MSVDDNNKLGVWPRPESYFLSSFFRRRIIMCKKFIYSIFIFVLSFTCVSYADIVIGDFEQRRMGANVGGTSSNVQLQYNWSDVG